MNRIRLSLLLAVFLVCGLHGIVAGIICNRASCIDITQAIADDVNNPPPPPPPPCEPYCCDGEPSQYPCTCDGGDGSGTSSLHMKFGLGKSWDGQSLAGHLEIKSEFPLPELSSPSVLRVRGKLSNFESRFDNGTLRQIMAAQALVDVQIISATEYHLLYYDPSAATGTVQGFYAINTNIPPYAVWKVLNPDGTNAFNRLTITKWVDGEQKESHAFVWNGTNRSWTLTKGNELEILYTADIQADGLSPQSASIPSGTTLFPSYALSSNQPVVSPFSFSAVLPTGNYAVAIQTPVGTYYTGPKALPGSGYDTNADRFVLAELPQHGGTGSVARKEIKLWKDASGVVAKVEYRLQDLTFWNNGERKLPIVEIDDPDGAALTTVRTYYSDPYSEKRHGKLMSQVKPDGSWEWWDYDSLGRKILKLEPCLDIGSLSNGVPDPGTVAATYYSYESVDALDVPSVRHYLPRTIEKKVLGQTVEKTFDVYYPDSEGALVSIEEKATVPNAQYGQSNNLRTVTVTYTNGLLESLLKKKEYPDGRLETYTYETGSYQASNTVPGTFTAGTGNIVRQTIVYGTTESPSGIVYKTTMKRAVLNPFKKPLLEETFVKIPDGYDRMDWTLREYDELSREVAAHQANGLSKSATWLTCCAVSSESDYDGTKTTKEYDQNTHMISMTREGYTGFAHAVQADISTTYVYDGAGNVLKQMTSAGSLSQTTSNEYDLAGRIIKKVDSVGLITSYAYTNKDRIVVETQPGGATAITCKYKDGRLKSVSGSGVVNKFYQYGVSADGSTWTIVCMGSAGSNSPMQEKTITDMLGRTVRIEKPSCDGGIATNSFVFDAKGHYVKNTSPMGADKLFEYDDLGQETRRGLDVDGNGSLYPASMDHIADTESKYILVESNWWLETVQRVFATDNSNQATDVSIERVRQSGYLCACSASEIESVDSFSNVTHDTISIDANDKTVTKISSIPDSTNNTVKIIVNGLLQSATDKSGHTRTYSYDDLRRRIAVNDSRIGTKAIHYDASGRIDFVQDAASNRTTFLYDSTTGYEVEMLDAMSNIVYTAYDEQGRITNTWGATYPVAYRYDDVGRMVEMETWRNVMGGSDITAWKYDLATGLLTNKIRADGAVAKYSYDKARRLTRRVYARGVESAYNYDLLGHLTNIDYSDATPDVSLAYDRLGRLVRASNSVETYSNEYDGATTLIQQEHLDDGPTLSRAYDQYGRASGITVGGEYSMKYNYDSVGRFSSISSSVLSVSSVVMYSYVDDSDLIAGWTNDNTFNVTRGFEMNRDHLLSVDNRFGTNMISGHSYLNDVLGHRIQRVDYPSITNEFRYSARHELIDAVVGTSSVAFTYDSIGNRLTATNESDVDLYEANALNQYTNISGTITNDLYYDADGNMTNDGDLTYVWDAENRMIRASKGTNVVVNSYDYMSRLVKTIDNSVTNIYLYDGWNVIRDSSDNNKTNYYLWGLDLSGMLQGAGGVGGLLAVVRSQTQSVAFVAYDGNGNITDYVGTNGAILATYSYKAFGELLQSSGVDADSFAYRFSTKRLNRNAMVYYYGNRYYDPKIGRWLGRDPIESSSEPNLYGFVNNSPIDNVDYLGNFCIWKWVEEQLVEYCIPDPPQADPNKCQYHVVCDSVTLVQHLCLFTGQCETMCSYDCKQIATGVCGDEFFKSKKGQVYPKKATRYVDAGTGDTCPSCPASYDGGNVWIDSASE